MSIVDSLLDNWDPDHKKGISFTDHHTLLVKSGIGTNEQLEGVIRKSIKHFEEHFHRKFPCFLKTNLIMGRNGRFYGFGYLYVSNPEIYYLLLGLNPDGSERIEYINDPLWKSPEKDLDDAIDEIVYIGTSWADWADQEDEVRKKYECPQIKKILPPLTIDLSFFYTPEQKELISSLAREKNFPLPSIPDKGVFTLSPAQVYELDENYSPNVLCCREVPKWMNDNDLKKIFVPFTSDAITKNYRKFNGNFIQDTYPFITLNDKNMSFITFDPKTNDAQFALLMTKKVTFTKGDKTTILIFSQSYKSRNQRDF